MISFPIEVSISSGSVDSFEILDELLKVKQQIEQDAANEFARILRQKANDELWTSKEKYLSAITVHSNEVSLNTDDFVVGMVEEGVPSYDMKPGLLNSSKVKISKDGKRYMAVPLSKFRHGKYNWRNRDNGQFAKTKTTGPVEFRIVSDKSPADSWIHPGYKGQHFMKETEDELLESQFIENQLQEFINKNNK